MSKATEKGGETLVWVKDNAGNMFICPINALRDPKTVSDKEKKTCVDDASAIMNQPASRPGHLRP